MEWQDFPDPPAWESFDGRYPLMPREHCFINAYRLTRCFPELRYVEGEAGPLFDVDADEPKPHAWWIDGDGVVVDATWGNDACAYYGVIFDRETINQFALETGFWDLTALDWLEARESGEALGRRSGLLRSTVIAAAKRAAVANLTKPDKRGARSAFRALRIPRRRLG